MGDLRESRLQKDSPFLAYLSACPAAANQAVRLADEGIHLVSAFQLAIFRHIVGTLWEISDKHWVEVARMPYETMQAERITDMMICRGLRRGLKALRDRRIKDGG